MNPHHVSQALFDVAQVRDQRIAALETELASARNLYAAQEERYERGRKAEDAARDCVAALETQVAELTADKERLDRLEAWMRDDGATVRYSSDGFHIFYRGQALACNQPSLRAAIDAARKAAQG